MSTDQLSPTPLNSSPRWFLPALGALLAFIGGFVAVRALPPRPAPVLAPHGELALIARRVIAGVDKGPLISEGTAGSVELAAVSAVAGQAAYLREAAKREAEDWAALSAAERADKRAELKASMLEGQ